MNPVFARAATPDKAPRRQLEAADREHLRQLRKFTRDLAAKPEGGGRMLDHTMVLYGSNLGDANIHDTTNLPILLAGETEAFAYSTGNLNEITV